MTYYQIHTKDFIQKFQSYLSIKASTSPLGQPTGHLMFWILMHWQCRIGSFACKHHSNFFLAICAQKQTLYLLTPLYLKHLHSAGSNFSPHPGMVQIPYPQGTGLKHSHAHSPERGRERGMKLDAWLCDIREPAKVLVWQTKKKYYI